MNATNAKQKSASLSTGFSSKTPDAKVFPINVKSLAASLVENTRSGKAAAFRHKGYLDLIAQSQGFENFKAMQAKAGQADGTKNQGSTSSKPKVSAQSGLGVLSEQKVREIAEEVYGTSHADDLRFYELLLASSKGAAVASAQSSQFSSGSLYSVVGLRAIETGIRVNVATHRIEFPLGYQYDTCEREFIVMGADVRHVVRNPFNPMDAYALRTAEHFEQAIERKTALLSSSSIFRFNGMTVEYGMNGDWFSEVESAFDSVEHVFEQDQETDTLTPKNLAQALSDTNVWFAESKVDFDLYEFYVDALDLLFSKLTRKTLSIQKEGEEPLTIYCMK